MWRRIVHISSSWSAGFWKKATAPALAGGQSEIEDHQVRIDPAQRDHRGNRIGRRAHVVAVAFQQHRQTPLRRLVVVDDQNLLGTHVRSPRAASYADGCFGSVK
jgi:hypothetical protein